MTVFSRQPDWFTRPASVVHPILIFVSYLRPFNIRMLKRVSFTIPVSLAQPDEEGVGAIEIIDASDAQDARHLLKNSTGIRYETQRIGVINNVKSFLLETREVAHITLNYFNVDAVMRGGLGIPPQLSFGEIEDRHIRSEQGESDGLLPAAARQAEYIFTGKISQPAFRIDPLTGRHSVQIQGRAGE